MELKEHFKNTINEIISKKFRSFPTSSIQWDVKKGTEKGDNYFGVIMCIHLSCNSVIGAKQDLYFVIKIAPESEKFRQMFPVNEAFQREHYIYREVLPAFQKFQEDHAIKQPFTSYAQYYGSSIEVGKEFILMKDLKHFNYFMCNRKEVMDFEHSLLVFQELGRLHSLSFAMKDKNPYLFRALSKNCKDIFFNNCNLEQMSESFEGNRQFVLEAFDTVKDGDVIEKVNKFFEDGFKRTLQWISPEAAGDYAVIGHGDTWINNLLFSYQGENNNKPSKICFLDWQLCRFGSPVLDLVYFLFSCTDQQMRDEHLDTLFTEYHRSLSTMLYEFGCDPDKLFPFNILMEHYKKFAIFGFTMATLITRIITSDSDETPDFVETCEKGIDQSKSLQFKSRNSHLYCKRMRDLALYCVEQNFI